MVAIICIDDNNGMMFNNRRQSKDRVLQEHILNLAGENRLWMNSYSKKQFSGANVEIIVDEDFLEKAGNDDYCFVENKDISEYSEKIRKVILFKWNRKYPSDTFLTLDMDKWTLEEAEEFTGYSHEKITKEIYKR